MDWISSFEYLLKHLINFDQRTFADLLTVTKSKAEEMTLTEYINESWPS